MVNLDRSDRFPTSSEISHMLLQKSFWIVLLAMLGGLLAWFLYGNEDVGNTPLATDLIFANAAAAEAYASRTDAETPDYRQYADLIIPPLPPEKALETFDLEDGFRIEIVAHEPDVVDPVAMDIDADGRLWVVEMRSYMPVYNKGADVTSELERVPQSRIVILEDTTGEGRMDHSWVFMDELILPRAIQVMDDGVLIAEPPNVWFIQDTTGDGIGDTKELVYDHYGDLASDNVEHMANGLMWGMDNWIHSAYSSISLRRVNGQWQTRPFERLDQWGITQNNWGQLYSSHNTNTLITHLVPYGYSHRHGDFDLEEGINENIAESETMWPAHPTGVNRGYRDGVLREDSTLMHSTATCGPVIYRGDQFGEEYRGNAFVAEPAGNLIKRLVGINEAPGKIEAVARFAYEGREFLTSTDERFRPVNIYNAPDGSIYVLDMYRGIFQHATYLTDYLRDYAVEHDLHKPTGKSRFGRIYRIVREDRAIDYNSPKLSEKEPDELVRYLIHKNGLLRDQAQQLLVQRSPAEVVSTLESFVRDESLEFYTRLQALWTLEGFDKNSYEPDRLSDIARAALDDPHPRIRAAAIRILEPEIRQGSTDMLTLLERMSTRESAPYVQLQLLASLGESNDPAALSVIAGILDEHAGSPYFREMALTDVYQQESELLGILRKEDNWDEGENDGKDWILEHLTKMAEKTSGQDLQLTGEERRLFELGQQQFRTCMACHGGRGEGIEGAVPPLDGSEWVRGNPQALVRIVLHGFEGDAGVMPAHGYMSDEEVAAILTYIRQSWSNNAQPITIETVADIRKTTQDHHGEWTSDELRDLSE